MTTATKPKEISICANCGTATDMNGPLWQSSVNLTPDMLCVHHYSFEWGHPLVEIDVAYDWCNPLCFAQWLFRAVVELRPRPRP